MKKNLLSVAVAASAAGVASLSTAQMYLNSEGTGEALVFPFYSAQGGNDTYIQIGNTTSHYKAVRVRVVEGKAGLGAAEFNLYLSPEDHFSFAITSDGDGARMLTGDSSCTVPQITGPVSFSDALWGGADESREQMGYLEVIEMGQIVATSDTAADIPGDCAQLATNWSAGGAWATEASSGNVGTTDFMSNWHGGGLFGVATVINVAAGSSFGYNAIAIADAIESGSSGSVLHYQYDAAGPDFDAAAMADSALITVNGVRTTYDGSSGANYGPVSALLMSQSITNEYVIDPALSALTDWVVTMPTMGDHLSGSQLAPFASTTDQCQLVGMTTYNREGSMKMSSNDLQLCAATNVVHFGSSSATNSSSNLVSAAGAVDGWAAGWATLGLHTDDVVGSVDTPRNLAGSVDGQTDPLAGLPVTGFAVVEYANGSTLYQQAWDHKTDVATSVAASTD